MHVVHPWLKVARALPSEPPRLSAFSRHPLGGPMRSILKVIIVAPAIVLAAGCSKDKPADPALNNDLSLAAQANPNSRLDSISAAERANAAAAPQANNLRTSTTPAAAAPARRTTSSSSTRRASSSG